MRTVPPGRGLHAEVDQAPGPAPPSADADEGTAAERLQGRRPSACASASAAAYKVSGRIPSVPLAAWGTAGAGSIARVLQTCAQRHRPGAPPAPEPGCACRRQQIQCVWLSGGQEVTPWSLHAASVGRRLIPAPPVGRVRRWAGVVFGDDAADRVPACSRETSSRALSQARWQAATRPGGVLSLGLQCQMQVVHLVPASVLPASPVQDRAQSRAVPAHRQGAAEAVNRYGKQVARHPVPPCRCRRWGSGCASRLSVWRRIMVPSDHTAAQAVRAKTAES